MLVDARFPTLARIRYGCGVQSRHQKLNLQVFSRGDFRKFFHNFKKFWFLEDFSDFFKNFIKIFLWSEIFEN